MNTKTFDTPALMGEAAGNHAALKIESAISEYGEANIILATGASQFHTLKTLVGYGIIDWSKVTVFHLDEYLGIDEHHPASFRLYLKQRFLEHVGSVREFHFIDGTAENPRDECKRLNDLVAPLEIQVALVGIGENGHLAFNDPPADFEVEDPYIIADLDKKCRLQQVGEGWFDGLEDVPTQAISMTVKQIMKSKSIICSVPDERKARAVKDCVLGEISNMHPASILQNHGDCTIYLDKESAKLL
ncbi:MAG: glucosamine-6-phosphate deaminase [Cytophagales bacterium]|nr:glucosamine-6-phosphate deaminase [Cytophagales bacterium]